MIKNFYDNQKNNSIIIYDKNTQIRVGSIFLNNNRFSIATTSFTKKNFFFTFSNAIPFNFKTELMNKSLLTFIFLVFSAGLFAQSPNAFNYQAALRDNQGALLNNQFVGLKIEIENSTGIVYAEEYVV